jgi:hypothetical protein
VIGAGIIHPICNRFMTEMLSFGCTQHTGGPLGGRIECALMRVFGAPRSGSDSHFKQPAP